MLTTTTATTTMIITTTTTITTIAAAAAAVERLLVILTSSINIPVIYFLVLHAIYLQIDIYPRFIYKLILFLNWV